VTSISVQVPEGVPLAALTVSVAFRPLFVVAVAPLEVCTVVDDVIWLVNREPLSLPSILTG
jgi:hypothetical protein